MLEQSSLSTCTVHHLPGRDWYYLFGPVNSGARNLAFGRGRVCHPAPVQRVGIRDTFCRSGDPAVLFPEYGLGVDDIVRAAERALALKKKAEA